MRLVSISWFRLIWATGTLALSASLGCEGTGNEGWGQPLILPQAAKLEETVAMAIDSNYIPFLPQGSYHVLDRDSVKLQLEQAGTVLAVVDPLAVFHDTPTPTSIILQALPGAEIAVVLFNLPAALPNFTPPGTISVRLLYNGEDSSAVVNDLQITGVGGTPLLIAEHLEAQMPEDLEPRPTLRLRPRFNTSTQVGFDPAWTDIGTVEFTLQFPTTAVTAPEAFGAGEAANANALVGPEGQPGEVRIVMVEPNGIEMDMAFCIDPGSTDCRVGAGPIIDVSFDKVMGGPGFSGSDFTIKGLAVYDRDGVLLSTPMGAQDDATAYFERLTMNDHPGS